MVANANPEKLSAFGLVQFIASVHIFGHHVWQRTNYLAQSQIRGWGVSWVACFFLLSGFKLTYSQLKRKDPSKLDPFVPYLWRRLLRLYPIYYLSLFMTLLLSLWQDANEPKWINLPFNLILTFTWIGSRVSGWHSGWHGAHWYLSDLTFHQILWRYTYPRILRLSVPACWLGLAVCVLTTLLRCLGIQLGYCEQKTVFFAPYTFNQFLSGVFLARLHVARPARQDGVPGDRVALVVGERRIPLTGLASLGLVLLIFWFVNPGRIESWLKNSLWSGIFLPLHVLMIWCLCLEKGPIDWFCQVWPFSLMGEISYGIYILHWNITILAMHYGKIMLPQNIPESFRFFFILVPVTVIFSALVLHFIDRPIQAWGARLLRKQPAVGEAHAKAS